MRSIWRIGQESRQRACCSRLHRCSEVEVDGVRPPLLPKARKREKQRPGNPLHEPHFFAENPQSRNPVIHNIPQVGSVIWIRNRCSTPLSGRGFWGRNRRRRHGDDERRTTPGDGRPMIERMRLVGAQKEAPPPLGPTPPKKAPGYPGIRTGWDSTDFNVHDSQERKRLASRVDFLHSLLRDGDEAGASGDV